tara:strand:- start:293 stop:454 length:162 start_codon:yes stop_codon:yes gene_type:complete
MDWSLYFDETHDDIDGRGWNVTESNSAIAARFETAEQALDWLRTQLLTNDGGA